MSSMAAGVNGLQRASAGIARGGEAVVRAGIEGIQALERATSKDKVSMSDEARAHLDGKPAASIEDGMLEMKTHSAAYRASAGVIAKEDERLQTLMSVVSQHQDMYR